MANDLSSDFDGIPVEDLYDSEQPLVPGRSCGSCMLCCTVLMVPELKKPFGVKCTHAVAGRGCAIHANRPAFCRQFFCGWRLDPNIDALWKPDICGFVLTINLQYSALLLMVDPARPLAWRMQPYYGRLREWSGRAFKENKRIVAMVHGEATVILPDRDVPLGMLAPDDEIFLSQDASGYHAIARRRRA
ncbi:MAG TPA: hypothetical protein VIY51_27280 [Xanthobacteraceae bacterium]